MKTVFLFALLLLGGGWKNHESPQKTLDNKDSLNIQLSYLKEWVQSKAEFYFPNQTHYGQIGDAYRHVLGAALMRKQSGIVAAKCSGWLYEAWGRINRSNKVRDRIMDLHNNKLGYKFWYSEIKNENPDTLAFRVFSKFRNTTDFCFLNWINEKNLKPATARKDIQTCLGYNRVVYYKK